MKLQRLVRSEKNRGELPMNEVEKRFYCHGLSENRSMRFGCEGMQPQVLVERIHSSTVNRETAKHLYYAAVEWITQ